MNEVTPFVPHDQELNSAQVALLKQIAYCYAHWTGHALCAEETHDATRLAMQLHHAPWALLAHNHQADPMFIYGNLTALALFATDMPTLCQTPSRLSAETPLQSERQALLDTVSRQGYSSHYAGIRISREGRRFLIRNATVWNLLDSSGQYFGQAACFSEWEWL